MAAQRTSQLRHIRRLPTPARQRRTLTGSAFVVAAAVAMAPVLAGCGADAQSATAEPDAAVTSAVAAGAAAAVDTAPLTVDKPDVANAVVADCLGAKRQHNNHNNVCAVWENNAPSFSGPGQLSTAGNFTVTSFDGNAGSHHHVNATPGTFGDGTWGATSAEHFYDATMAWQFTSAEPADTVSGTAQLIYNGPTSSNCTTGQQYLSCFVTKAATVEPFDGERLYQVAYGIFNAPLTVQVRNNTGKTMTLQGPPAQSFVLPSAKGTSGTDTIAPASDGRANAAIWSMYRSNGGQPASFQVTYSFADTTDAAVTHTVTVTADVTPVNPGGDARSWTVNTSKSTCVDNPIGGSSPAKAQCTIGWTGNSGWFQSAVMTVTVSNA